MRIKQIVFLGLSLLHFTASAQTIKALSFNIRYSNDKDGVNSWENRKQWATDYVRLFDFDVIGFQEVQNDQKVDLDILLPAYKSISTASDTNKPNGDYEACSIYYNPKRLKCVSSGTFWLSETPEKQSMNWDSLYNRVVTWGKFIDVRNKSVFYFFNTHLPHKSEPARMKSVKLLREMICKIATGNSNVIVTGDFNAHPNSEPYNAMLAKSSCLPLTDAKKAAKWIYAPDFTVNCFGTCDGESGYIIDFLFVSSKIEIEKYVVLTERRKDIFISDHYPVFCEIKFIK